MKKNVPSVSLDTQLEYVEEMLKQGISEAKKNHAEQFEIFANFQISEIIEAERGTIKSFRTVYKNGVAIKLVYKNRLCFATGTNPEKTAKNAITSATAGENVKGFVFPEPNKKISKALAQNKNLNNLLGLDEMQQILEQEIDMKTYFTVPSANIEKSTNLYGIANSSGIFCTAVTSTIASEIFVNYKNSSGYASVIAKNKQAFEKERYKLQKAKDSAKAFYNAGTVKSSGKPRNVVLRDEALAGILSILFNSITAESYFIGTSRLMLKKQELGKNITISDINEHQIAPTVYIDGEGLATSEKIIFKNGVLENLLCKSLNCWKLNKKLGHKYSKNITPGNASRFNYNSEIHECFNCAVFHPGKGINIEKGDIIVEEVQGLHTVDKTTGNFSLAVEHGFLVGNGLHEKPVSRFAISGNVFEVFKHCEIDKKPSLLFGEIVAPEIKTKLIVTG